jgi:hypothetical protein
VADGAFEQLTDPGQHLRPREQQNSKLHEELPFPARP